LKEDTRSFPLGNVIIKADGGKIQKATNVYAMPNGVKYIRVEESGFETSTTSSKKLSPLGVAKRRQCRCYKKWLKKEARNIYRRLQHGF
jgi:hypothetical protein